MKIIDHISNIYPIFNKKSYNIKSTSIKSSFIMATVYSVTISSLQHASWLGSAHFSCIPEMKSIVDIDFWKFLVKLKEICQTPKLSFTFCKIQRNIYCFKIFHYLIKFWGINITKTKYDDIKSCVSSEWVPYKSITRTILYE